jgi:hypothetical protein
MGNSFGGLTSVTTPIPSIVVSLESWVLVVLHALVSLLALCDVFIPLVFLMSFITLTWPVWGAACQQRGCLFRSEVIALRLMQKLEGLACLTPSRTQRLRTVRQYIHGQPKRLLPYYL